MEVGNEVYFIDPKDAMYDGEYTIKKMRPDGYCELWNDEVGFHHGHVDQMELLK